MYELIKFRCLEDKWPLNIQEVDGAVPESQIFLGYTFTFIWEKKSAAWFVLTLARRDLIRAIHWAMGNGTPIAIHKEVVFAVPWLFLKTDWRCVVAGWGLFSGIRSSVRLLSHFCHALQSGHLQVMLCFTRYGGSCASWEWAFMSAGSWFSICLCSKQSTWFYVLFAHQVPRKSHFFTLMSILF